MKFAPLLNNILLTRSSTAKQRSLEFYTGFCKRCKHFAKKDVSSGPPVLAVVVWHPQAPTKPALGAPCNGCGLCCLAAPCPLGIWVSRRRTGACKALLWSDDQQRYQCGLLADPAQITGWRRPWLLRWCSRLAQRWIAAGTGCDADLEWEKMPPIDID